MTKVLTQAQFITLEALIRKYKRTGKGATQEEWAKYRKCTREALLKAKMIRQEFCCDCMEPTEKGFEYVKEMNRELKKAAKK